MRLRKLLKVTSITVLSIVVLLLLLIVAFVFNPFEGSLPNIRDVVPRNVDYFLRKVDLSSDIVEFPEPVFWNELSESKAWRQWKGLSTYKELMRNGEVTRSLEEARQLANQLKDSQLDLMSDLLGNEVLLAGRFRSARLEESALCAYLRVSWKIRAAFGLANYAFVQEKLRLNGISLRPDGEMFEVTVQGAPKPWWVARYHDCVMLGNDRELVADSMNLTKGGGGDAFGTSSSYLDGVDGRLREWQQATQLERLNALEFHMRPDELFNRTKWDDGWPDPNHPTDMNSRVLASFLNLQGWQFLSGALSFEGDSLAALARVDLNRNRHTQFQAKFFKAEEQARADWLDPFLRFVPASACAAAGLRMPAGDFVREMFGALEKAAQDLVNDRLRRTGTYNSFSDLIDRLELALLPRTGFVFRKNVPDETVAVADRVAVPQVAWVFWAKEGQKQVLEEFLKFMQAHATTLGFSKVLTWKLDVSDDLIFEFLQPQITGTGEIAGIMFDRYFIVGNSAPLIREMFHVRFKKPELGITRNPNFDRFMGELPRAVNGFAFVQGRQLEDMLLDFDRSAAESAMNPSPEWMQEHRPAIEAEVFRRSYAQYASSIDKLDAGKREQLQEDIRERMREDWKRLGPGASASSREGIQQAIALSRSFSSAYLQVELDPQWMKLAARFQLEYR